MKYLALLLLLCTTTAFGQSGIKAQAEKPEKLLSSKETGVYHFSLPSTISKAQVDQAADYYKNAFSIQFNEKKHEINLKLIENTAPNRLTMKRLFISLGINELDVNGSAMKLDDFCMQYLK